MRELKKRLAKILIERSYREGDFTLASGRKSDYYFDCRQTALHPEGSWLIGTLFNELLADLDIKGIGADNPVLDSQVPVRQILEQLVARTGIPPFLLGLSWSSTERMSAQQADLMTSEITALRRTLEPAVERICEMWLRLHGWGGDVTVDWADINLQDFVEEARAKLYLAQAEAIREEERT